MAKSISLDSGTLYTPGGYGQYNVQSAQSGLATTGVLMLVGEADSGPDFTQEEDLEKNAFGPDQKAEVMLKYGSGALVDAFCAAVVAANDPDITGSFSSCVLVKTNKSERATGTLPKIGGGTYSALVAKSVGVTGNAVSFRTIQAQGETLPTTGPFTFISPVGNLDYRIRANGGAAVGATIPAGSTPAGFVSAVDALVGVVATGGANRNLLTSAGGRSVALTAAGNVVTFAISGGAWDNIPTVGDTFLLPFAAPAALRGAGDGNVGSYVVVAASSASITATKLSDYDRALAVPGTITPPVTVPLTALAVTASTDLVVYGSVTVSVDAGPVNDGAGKALEIAELVNATPGSDLLSRTAYVLGTTTPVTWMSRPQSAKLLTSATEYQVTLNVANSTTLATETFTEGGEIVLKMGYAGDTGTLTVTDDLLTTTVTGGIGGDLTLDLNTFGSLQALADYINSRPGYTCSVGTAALGQLQAYALDDVTVGIADQWGSQPGRVKADGYRFFNAIDQGSGLVQLGDPASPNGAGLPDLMAGEEFLAGGLLGATTDADVTAAYTALEEVRGNFLVPLFSRDASADVLDGLTDTSSTYTITGIHTGAKSHAIAMSSIKRRRNRQAFLSVADTFAASQEVAANIASFRSAMAFEDIREPNAFGTIEQFLPWMAAVKAASMQAAGFYRNIEFKGVNIVGCLHRDGSFRPKNDTQVEQALKAGLLILRPSLDGGYVFVSDQTTYGKDSNFVFNSIQAVYAADTITLTMAMRMEKAIVGQSVADISAPAAKAIAEGVLADMLKLKLIAPSDDGAPKGYKDLSIKIVGNALLVNCAIKLATAIDFVIIQFQVSPVQQSA